MYIEKSLFGKTADGVEVDQYICTNTAGTVLKMINYGATIVALETADSSGVPGNIILGFDSVAGYEGHDAYFGATIGRFGNRIAGGRFTLGGEEYKLATNNGAAHLHGGLKGFDKVVWDAEAVQGEDFAGIRFSYSSPDGEEGYPGTLIVSVVYTLNNADELRIEYAARTDKTTVVNLTNHAYWNLSAGSASTILEHSIQIEAEQFHDIDADMIPTCEESVSGTAMDFTSARAIGERIAELKTDPDGPKGYDHNFKLRHQDGKLARAAFVVDPVSGRSMEVLTTEPGVQFYSGNFLDGGLANGGHAQHAAFCLETQHFPDSPNRPDFPSVELEPGEEFRSTTVYRFGCAGDLK
jgi:aldose 1-epimerase